MNDELRCIGCGAIIQTKNPNKIGFLDANILSKEKETTYCKRCFALMNYNSMEKSPLTSDDYLKIINKISKEDALIINLVDIFDFSGSFVPQIKRLTGQKDILLVGNKIDLMPKSVKERKITNWMRHMAKLDGVTILDAMLISSKKGNNIDGLMDMIDKHSNGRNVYVVGSANTGKSTLINSIIKKYSNCTKDVITTSIIPGTTLDFIEIPYKNTYIIDTPGLLNENQIVHQLLSVESIKKVFPRREIRPIVFQLNPKQTVFISGLAQFNFLQGERTGFIFHFSENLYLHRTKMENSSEVFEKHIGELLNPPTRDEYLGFKYQESFFKINDDGKKYDVVISGLGFITMKGALQISVKSLTGVGVYIRDAII